MPVMIDGAELLAFLHVSDLGRAAAFYGGVLGLPVVSQDQFAVVVDADGVEVRITAVEDRTPAPATVLGWKVPDIEAAVAALTAAGVGFTRYDGIDQDDAGVWTTPDGTRVAWFQDPDGNVLSLSQHG